MTADLLRPPAPVLSERESARRRTHLLAELAGATPARRRAARPRIAAAVVLAALVAALAAVLPGRLEHTQMTLVAQALAAIGSGPTIHVVLDQGPEAELVDLNTGRTRKLDERVEVWSDRKLGTLWVVTLGGREAQAVTARRGDRAAANEAWGPFVEGYRAQLRAGSFHVVGRGTYAGQPVEWIAGAPVSSRDGRRFVQEIAISRVTYKPLYMRERVDGRVEPGSGVRVLVAETQPRRPAVFAHRPTAGPFGFTGGLGTSTGIPTTIRAARAAMDPDPVVPVRRIAGLARSWIGLPDALRPPANSYRDQVGGVTFYYGRLDSTGHPSYQGRYVSINEIPKRRDVHAFLGPAFFRAGAAVISTKVGARWTAALRVRGLYVVVQATTRADAVAAARALAAH